MLVLLRLPQHLLVSYGASERFDLAQHNLEECGFADPVVAHKCDSGVHVYGEFQVPVQYLVGGLAEVDVTYLDECALLLVHIDEPKLEVVVLVHFFGEPIALHALECLFT